MNGIKIGGYMISIEKNSLLSDCHNHIGEYSPIEQKIRILDRLTKQQEKEVLIHEIIEAINDIYELNLLHDEQLSLLSVVLHQIIVDNPGLIRTLIN